MASHEFGILFAHEEQNEQFYLYTPERFHSISIDMDLIDGCGFIGETLDMPTFWHELSRPSHGLNEMGITLIPPTSLPDLRAAAIRHGFYELAAMAEHALSLGCYIIHFGI